MERLPQGASAPETQNYAAWLSVILGLGIFVLHWASPRGTFDIKRNLFFSGLLIIFTGLATAISHQGRSHRNYWSVINVATGLWLIVSRGFFVPIATVSVGQLLLGIAIIVVAIIAQFTELFGVS